MRWCAACRQVVDLRLQSVKRVIALKSSTKLPVYQTTKLMKLPLMTLAGLCTLSTLPVSAALNIDYNFDASVNMDAQAAAIRAASVWENALNDSVTVTVDFGFSSLGATTLGSTSAVQLAAGFDTIRNRMVIDNAFESAPDAIVNYLPTAATASFSALTNYGGNPISYGLSGNISASKANLKSLGFTGLDTQFGASDGAFNFSTDFNFDFDNSDGVATGSYDFESVVLHEIAHLLGFISVVDQIDARLAAGETSILGISPTALDLFRFDSENLPTNDAEFTAFARDLSTEDSASLSNVSIAYAMETGVQTGSGQQASHFKDNSDLGTLDPTLAPGEIAALSTADLLALDLIGWDVDSLLLPVPEPRACGVIAASLAFLCVILRRPCR